MKKRRKFADGGVTGVQQPTYPFYGNTPQAGGQNGGMNQTFNIQPQAQAGPNDQMGQRFAKGGQAKVGKVMSEFKAGKLKSSSGQKVTNPKQAIAIGLSEAGLSKKAKGGAMKESKMMMKKEVEFMKKKGAPKSMVKHEMKEAGMKKMAKGGRIQSMSPNMDADVSDDDYKKEMRNQRMKDMGILGATLLGAGTRGVAAYGDYKGSKLAEKREAEKSRYSYGGKVKKMASGGLAAGHKSADGVATKGKTKAMQVKMAKGGMTKKAYGGKC